MTAAIFGLIGVLVGGGITYFTEWSLEHRREKTATRAAGRLVLEDLISAWTAFAVNGQTDRWIPEFVDGSLPNANWVAQKEQLARTLSDDEWRGVALAFLAIDGQNSGAARRELGQRIPDQEKPDLAADMDRVGEGMRALSNRIRDGRKLLRGVSVSVGGVRIEAAGDRS